MGIILVFASAQAAGRMLVVLLFGSLLLVGGGAGASVLMHRSQMAAYRRGSRQRLELYYGLLASTRDRLIALPDEQRRLLLDKDPDPLICPDIARARGSRLWERSPADADFLVLRAGPGVQVASAAYELPALLDALEASAKPGIRGCWQSTTWKGCSGRRTTTPSSAWRVWSRRAPRGAVRGQGDSGCLHLRSPGATGAHPAADDAARRHGWWSLRPCRRRAPKYV
jgi:hypothetical protein